MVSLDPALERSPPEKVPAVSLDVQKNGNPAVGLDARRRNKSDPRGEHPLERRFEIVDPKKKADSPGELLAYDLPLVVSIGACQQDARRTAGRTNDDPALRPAVVGH